MTLAKALPRELASLLDHARAERKKHDHRETLVVHLAAAAVERLGALVLDAFPEARDSVERLVGQVVRGPSAGSGTDSPAVLSLLASVGAEEGWEHRLIGLLRPYLSAALDTQLADIAASTSPVALDALLTPDLASLVEVVGLDESIVGLDEMAKQVLSLIGQRTPTPPLLVAAAGGGRTSALKAVAQALQASDEARGDGVGRPLLRLRTRDVLARDSSAQSLGEVVRWASSLPPHLRPVLAIDDLESLLALSSPEPNRSMAGAVARLVDGSAIRVVLTIEEAHVPRLRSLAPALVDMVATIPVPRPDDAQLREIARKHIRTLSAFHDVELPDDVIELAMAPAEPGTRQAHPGLLHSRLDAACARAAVHGRREVTAADFSEGVRAEPVDVTRLVEHLTDVVKGQDDAVERIASRLAITSAGLDLRPRRPDGVFLAVGPSGVGKTKLATVLAEALFGEASALIRLDMTEYSQEWALSRIIGPQPGYVGYQEPEGWLTTRVRAQPRAVILLDEFEKAHPMVWNAFLQVFDYGTLTDARGAITSFSDTIVILTSNLGSREFSKATIGFARDTNRRDAEQAVLRTVDDSLPPELRNRLDDIVVFHPLSLETIRAIAEREVMRASDRLSSLGYTLDVPPAVIDSIASYGYEPTYGARHVHRSIERHVLEPLVRLSPGRYRARSDGANIEWETAAAEVD